MHLLAAAADLVLPRSCVACRSPGELLCGRCAPARPPLRIGAAGTTVGAAGWYDAALREALIAYKERGRRDLARPLGRCLARAAAAVPAESWVAIVPVPSSGAAARARGGDHVARLARHAGAALGVRVLPALRLTRRVSDSAALGADERGVNLAGAMAAAGPRGGPHPPHALVVDDILTSGATLTEAIRALRAAGWAVSSAAVVAATPRRAASPAR